MLVALLFILSVKKSQLNAALLLGSISFRSWVLSSPSFSPSPEATFSGPDIRPPSKRAFFTFSCALCPSRSSIYFSRRSPMPPPSLLRSNSPYSSLPNKNVWCLDNLATLLMTFSLKSLVLKLCWAHSFMPGDIMENVRQVVARVVLSVFMRKYFIFRVSFFKPSIKIVSAGKY